MNFVIILTVKEGVLCSSLIDIFLLFRGVLCGIKSLEFYASVLLRTNPYEIFGYQICDGMVLLPLPRFSSVSIIPPLLHTPPNLNTVLSE